MALVTPNNLYSGYAQVVNDAQHVAFRTRILQHHFAQQQALDDYYRKMPMTINEKGTRDIDRPSLAKSLLGLKDYYIQHKNELRNGDQAAAFNYEKMIRNHQDLVQTSQAEGLTDTHVGKLKFDPKTSYIFQPPNMVEQLSKSHLPVDDPNFEPFDLDTALIPPKPLVKDDYMKRYDKIKFDDNVGEPIHNSDGTVTRINTPTPSNETLETIKSGALVDYLHDPSVTKAVDELGTDASNPYNPIFKKYFGKDIENGADATTAYILANKLPQPSTQTVKPDLQAATKQRQQFAKEQQARQFAHSDLLQRRGFAHADIKGKSDAVESADSVLHNVADILKAGEESDKFSNAVGQKFYGGRENIPVTISDPSLLKMFSGIKKSGTTPIPPDKVEFDKKSDQFKLIYNAYTYTEKDANGKDVSKTEDAATIPMSGRDYVKLKVKDTYPNKDVGDINNLVDKIIIKNGGLANTLKMYDPDFKAPTPKVETPKSSTHKTTSKGLPILK